MKMTSAALWRHVEFGETDHRTRTAEMRFLRRRAVAAELPDPGLVACFHAVVNEHMIIAAVVIPLHVKLLELQLDYLTRKRETVSVHSVLSVACC